MSATGGRRRLEAILAADASGYSRLMAADEDATVAALDAGRAVFRAQIEANQGRVIDMAGDSVLAVFETAAGAVAAALEIQKELNSPADSATEDRRMRFRIGVHLGDVIEKPDGTIYGDGVNIAARLQALAEPGGITVSAMIEEAVRGRVTVAFEDLGRHEVKNIARPVHVYRVDFGGGSAAARAARRLARSARSLRWWVASATVVLLAVAIGVSLATFLRKPPHPLSGRASIAVLPLVNQSGDPRADYFSEGITEDIISALGRFSGVMVISHSTVRAYKGRPATPVEISRELGVRYVAQGSVRQADGRLRVALELSDAEKGMQLWSERFEGEGAQVFEIQDRIVKNIVGIMAVKLTQIEQQRIFTRPTDSLEAYNLVLRARALLELNERRANREARALLARAQTLSPGYAEIFNGLCQAELHRALYGWIEDASEAMKRAEELCKRALASPDQRPHARALALMASIYSNQDRFEEALGYAERAIELNASDSAALHSRGMTLLYVGRINEAITAMETAKRFDPHAVTLNLAVAYYVAERYREALEQADLSLARIPHHIGLNAIRTAALSQLGNADEAQRAADQVRRFSPMFEVDNFGRRFADPKYTAKVREGLRKAGL